MSHVVLEALDGPVSETPPLVVTRTNPGGLHVMPPSEPSLRSFDGPRGAEVTRTIAELVLASEARVVVPTEISARFMGAKFLSATFGILSAPTLAHAAVVESQPVLMLGLAFFAVAVGIQLIERRRAILQLTEVWQAAGLSKKAARRRARQALRSWLE